MAARRALQIRTSESFWEPVGQVESRTEDKTHTISRHRNTGSYACACLSFRFAKGEKTCDHLKSWWLTDIVTRNSGKAITVVDEAALVQPQVSTVTIDTKKGSKTFTVRRSFSFSA